MSLFCIDKLISQAHGPNTLPSPLDLHSQATLTAGSNLNPPKVWGLPNRPQTAQMFPNKSMSSPFKININSPNMRSDRNLQQFLETDSIKGFNSISVNRVPALNTNLKTPTGRTSRGSINPAMLKDMNPRKSSQLISQGLGYQEPEIMPSVFY